MSTDTAVPLEELAGLPEFYHASLSPDGERIAFYYDVSGRNELHVMDRATGEHRQVTDGEVSRDATWFLEWAADGEAVYVHRDEDGDEQNDILRVDADDGGAETVVAPDGQGILADSTADALLYRSDAGEQLNLYRHDLATGETDRLTAYDQPVGDALFSPGGERIAYLANESATLENRDVYLMAADGSENRRLAFGEDGSEAGLGGWFPDGERLLVDDDTDDTSRVGVYDLREEADRWLGTGEYEEAAVAVGPEGDRVLATRQRRGATMPVVYDLASGEGRELALPEGVSGIWTWRGPVFADASTLLLTHSTAAERKQLYEYDLGTDEYEVRLAAEYGDVPSETFVDASYVRYESEDGLEIGALLYDPREGPSRAADATDVPAVVMVHGGPHHRAARRFNLYVQFLVSRGYAVLQPNYRGSTGRGRAFRQAIHGDWGGMEQADVAAGGRWLMDRDWVDADRTAVFGGSYGGYSVYCQLTGYPTLWTTGIAWIGITDLHRLYAEDMPHFQHQLRTQMGDPEENHDLWRDRSPIEHVGSVERPLSMIHGVNDPRCPVEQARLFRDALLDRGWTAGEDGEFEYTELGEEGHGSTDIAQKIRVFRLFEDYLDRRL
jgi:dipeptidyl aminopeptidase/acylaminoacyl peptidase